jgi:nucleolar protein 56
MKPRNIVSTEVQEMKATILECTFGVLAFNEENELVDKALFPKKAQLAANTLAGIESGKMPDDVVSLIKRLQKDGYEILIFENANLAKETQAKLSVNVEVLKTSSAGELLRSRIEHFAIETEFVKDGAELSVWTHNITMELAKLRVRGAIEKRDLVVGQAIQTLDDLDRTINSLMSRIREWYGVHFPELDRLIEKHETYVRLIVSLGERDNFTAERLKDEGIPEAKSEGIAKTAEKSMGADVSETDLKEIQALCKAILTLYDSRKSLENYLDNTMEEVAPNTKAIVGSLLGARLIAISGGLSNLARKPASTIQVLGAEKALFRSLKTGTRPPKHGMIFQHTLLHDAKRWQRGKIARALAGKLAIAARVDAFGQRNIGNQLKADLDKRIDEIYEKYAEPPTIQDTKPTSERDKREKNRRKHRRER